MFGIHDFSLFAATGLLLNLYPGPDTAYIIARSVAQGRAAGIVSALGISTGGIIHTAAASLGLSAVLATSATAFTAIKLLGAGYLIYLGIQMILFRSPPTSDIAIKPTSIKRLYTQGLLTNILNPKVALFFLSFLPQFVDPASPYRSIALFILGCTFVTTGTIWCICLALFGSLLHGSVLRIGSVRRIMQTMTGGLFVFLGIRLATTK